MGRDRVGPLGAYLATFGAGADLSDAGSGSVFLLDEFVTQVDELLERHGLHGVELACEPGRYLVSEAMQILTRVHSVKRTHEHGAWVVVDAGLNILPTAGPAERRQYRLARPRAGPTGRFMLGGPLCYEGDVFSFDVELPADVRAGDLMLIPDAGAYSVSRSTNFIRPRACVVALRRGTAALCWRRETYDDIFAFRVARDHPEASHGLERATLHDHRPAAAFQGDAG
jgi:diaminopimelate decarboxylase